LRPGLKLTLPNSVACCFGLVWFFSLNPWKLNLIFFQPCSTEQKGCGHLAARAK
ncbi:unnamed protein product, partial [Bubo scandiacus]